MQYRVDDNCGDAAIATAAVQEQIAKAVDLKRIIEWLTFADVLLLFRAI